MMKKITEWIMTCILLICILLLSKEAVDVLRADEKKQVIVVDAGHGGRDPGVVGIQNIEEKGINLQIALKLKTCLEEAGYEIVMTRDDDYGLYDEDASNKKAQDMRNRVAMIDKAAPLLTISIHQNSFPDETVCGAQVFYHESSEEGKELAAALQQSLNQLPENTKKREIKSNESYYLLKYVESPIAIVECGFLTNPSEVLLLQNEMYQQKLVNAIAEGIQQYLEKKTV